MKAWIIWAIAVALVLLGMGAAYVHAIKSVEIASMNANAGSIDLTGFTINGELYVRNNGFVPVPIDHVEYKIYLPETEETFVIGTIAGKTLAPLSETPFMYTTRIDWKPTLAVLQDLLRPGHTNIVIEGKVVVSERFGINITFTQTVDIEEYLIQFVNQFVKETAVKVMEYLGF